MKRVLMLAIVLLVVTQISWAQNAMEFFHLGANLYVRGQLEQALQAVDQGLQKFPHDPYLQALKKKLEQKKKQQQQQQQNRQQQQQAKKEKQKQQQANKQQQQQQQQKQQTRSAKKEQMTREEAERILRALKEENKKFKKEHLRVPAGRRQLEKDW